MKLFRNKDLFQFSECLLIKAQRLLEEMRTTCQIIHSVVLPQASPIKDFKNRGRGGSETRPEVIFPISDEERMRETFSPELENAA